MQQPYVPLYFGGASGLAVEVGAKHGDVYALASIRCKTLSSTVVS